MAEQICQTKLEVTQHQQCFSVSDVVCSPVHGQDCHTITNKVVIASANKC